MPNFFVDYYLRCLIMSLDWMYIPELRDRLTCVFYHKEDNSVYNICSLDQFENTIEFLKAELDDLYIEIMPVAKYMVMDNPELYKDVPELKDYV